MVLGSTSALTQLIAFATLAIVARRIGPGNLGAYTVALSIVTFLSLPVSLGITTIGVRDLAPRQDLVRTITGEVFVLQMIISVASYVLLVALAPLLAPDAAIQQLIPIVALFLFTGTSFDWALQALNRMRLVAASRILGQVFFGALVPVLVVDGFPGARMYAWLMVGGLAVKHLATSIFLVKVAGMPDLRVSAARLRRRLKSSLSMGYASLMSQVYGQMDQLMLGYLSTARDAGEYAAAYRIPNAVLTFAGSWTGVVFPHTAELASTDRTRLRSQAAMMVTAIAMVSLPLAACAPFVADGLMSAAFGRQFGPAGPTFALLSVGLALALIDGTLSTLAVALGGDRSYASAVTVTAIFNVALNVAVIPILGRNGAAIDTIVAESLLFYRLVRVTNARLGGLRVEWGRLVRALVAASAAVGSLMLVPAGDLSVWLRIAMGAAVYAGGLVLFGAVRRDEIRSMLSRRETSAPVPDQGAPPRMPRPSGPLDLDMEVEWVPHLTREDMAILRRPTN